MSSDTIDPRLLDKRTSERYLQNGALDEKAWEKHLKSLPDLAEKAAPVEASLGLDDDIDDDEDDDLPEDAPAGG